MPVYEYRCAACGYEFEQHMRVGDPNPTCPQQFPTLELRGNGSSMMRACDGATEKKLSRTNFILRGGGWSKDGYG